MSQHVDIRAKRRTIVISFDYEVTDTELERVRKKINGFDDLVLTIKALAGYGFNPDTEPIVKEVLKLYGGSAA